MMLKPFQRYGVSQRLGRFVVTVGSVDVHTASVEIALENGALFRFYVAPSSPAPYSHQFENWEEWAARAAIAQSSTIRRWDSAAVNHPAPLEPGIRPWTGDLLMARYGGATNGVQVQAEQQIAGMGDTSAHFAKSAAQKNRILAALRFGNPPVDSMGSERPQLAPSGNKERRKRPFQDRRRASEQHDLVERGVELQRSAGDTAAIAFMLGHKIPQHVVLRVLACSSFRRNPARPSCRRSRAGEAGGGSDYSDPPSLPQTGQAVQDQHAHNGRLAMWSKSTSDG